MKNFIDWFMLKPRFIDGEIVKNQWYWFGAWIVYEPDEDNDPCRSYEIIYSKWRALIGWYRGKLFYQILFSFYPYRIASKD